MHRQMAVGALLLASASALAAGVECPATLDVTTSVVVPAGWEEIPSDWKPRVSGVTIYSGHPREMASQVPDQLPAAKGLERFQWNLRPDSSEYWVSCHYHGTTVAIAKQLPRGLDTCIAYYEKQRYGLGAYVRLTCQ